MLQNAYLLAKIGADTAENEQPFAEILPIGRRVTGGGEAAGEHLRLMVVVSPATPGAHASATSSAHLGAPRGTSARYFYFNSILTLFQLYSNSISIIILFQLYFNSISTQFQLYLQH